MLKIALAILAGAAAAAALLCRRPQDQVDDAMREPRQIVDDENERPMNDAAPREIPDENENEEDEAEAMSEIAAVITDETLLPEDDEDDVVSCRAEILSACRDMDPVTLQGWSRVSFLCEDDETRKFTFQGGNGVHLVSGETGLLEYRGAAFIGFAKDSGAYVSPLLYLEAQEE